MFLSNSGESEISFIEVLTGIIFSEFSYLIYQTVKSVLSIHATLNNLVWHDSF